MCLVEFSCARISWEIRKKSWNITADCTLVDALVSKDEATKKILPTFLKQPGKVKCPYILNTKMHVDEYNFFCF